MDNTKRLVTDAQVANDMELRVKLCNAEIEVVLKKYSLGIAFQEVRVNGQITSGQFLLLPVADQPEPAPGRVLNG